VDGSKISGTPRYEARVLPTPSRRQLARRALLVISSVIRHVGPVLLRRLFRRGGRVFDIAALAAPLRSVCEELGGTFVKFGQIVASSPGLFGDTLAEEFRRCLDDGPVVPFAMVRRVVESELGQSLDAVFASFDETPIGQASVAVVHRAQLLNGSRVAVKVLRPDIEMLIATDLHLAEPFFRFLFHQTGAQMLGAIVQQLDGLRLQIGEELDLRNEARALLHFRALVADSSYHLIAVPEPVLNFSTMSVLTMEFLDGVAIDDENSVETLGLNAADAIDQLIRGFFMMTVRWGAFHGDAHAGNLLLLRDGRIGVLDWGIVGRLDSATHHFFRKLLEAVLGVESAWDDVTGHIISNYGPVISSAMGMDDVQLAAFLRMMIEPLLLRPFGEVSFAEMFTMTQMHVARANDISFQSSSLLGLLRRLRVQRRIQRLSLANGGILTDFDRGNFLLGKQLMYFEKYGKIYLSDRAILSDRVFLEELLAEPDVFENGQG